MLDRILPFPIALRPSARGDAERAVLRGSISLCCLLHQKEENKIIIIIKKIIIKVTA